MAAMAADAHAIVVQYFHYSPEWRVAVAALEVFLVLTVCSAWMALKTRAWFTFIVTAVCMLEMGGYSARLHMLGHPSLAAYIAMQFFLIITPTLLALVLYLIVGRLLRLSGTDQVAYLKPHQISRLFATSDAVTLIIQISGGGLMAVKDPKLASMGTKLQLVGLGLQLAFFACFTCITIALHRGPQYHLATRTGARYMFGCLYASIALLTMRNTFRVVEFAQGYEGYLAVREAYLYSFDGILVALCVALLTVLHPGFLLAMMASTGVAGSPQASVLEVQPATGSASSKSSGGRKGSLSRLEKTQAASSSKTGKASDGKGSPHAMHSPLSPPDDISEVV